MSWLDALLLGVVEGLTEYLPVSSTGHLLLAQRALGLPKDAASDAYAICIQAGAIAAVLVLFRRRVGDALLGLVGRSASGRRLALALALAFLPAAVLGLAAQDVIRGTLFGLWPVVAAWAAGGLVLLALPRGGRRPGGAPLEALGARGALVVGLFQCLALWPGTSRSLVTILGGLVVGLSLPAAVEFSFLLGLVTLGAATVYEALAAGDALLAAYGPGEMWLGFLAAWISAAVSVRWMVAHLEAWGLRPFGVWRLALAAGTALALCFGWIAAR